MNGWNAIVARAGPGRQNRARNDLGRDGSAFTGFGPTDSDTVSALVLFLKSLDIILLAGAQKDRDGFLGRIFGPFTGTGPTRDGRDQSFVGRIVISAQPQFTRIIARDPKHIITAGRRSDITANASAIMVSPIDRSLEGREKITGAGIVRKSGAAGQVADIGARDVKPIFAKDIGPAHRARQNQNS